MTGTKRACLRKKGEQFPQSSDLYVKKTRASLSPCKLIFTIAKGNYFTFCKVQNISRSPCEHFTRLKDEFHCEAPLRSLSPCKLIFTIAKGNYFTFCRAQNISRSPCEHFTRLKDEFHCEAPLRHSSPVPNSALYLREPMKLSRIRTSSGLTSRQHM